jgi:hypothetical protein
MITKTVTITPQEARRRLDIDEKLREEGKVRTRQRPLTSGTISKLTSDIVNGDWHLNHQGAAITESGEIIDGRHRFYAIFFAKKAVKIQLTDRIPDDEAHAFMLSIDAHRPRDVGTQLWISEGLADSKHIVAAIRAQIALAKGVKREFSGVSAAMFKRLHDVQADGFKAILEIFNLQKVKFHSAILGTIAYYANAHRRNAIEFTELFATRAGLGKTSPILWLHRGLEEQYSKRDKRHRVGEMAFIVANAVMAFHLNKRVEGLPTADPEGGEWLASEAPKLTKLLLDVRSDKAHRDAIWTASHKLQRNGALIVD